MEYILSESPVILAKPLSVKQIPKRSNIRMECVLQTAGDVNRNHRKYDKATLQESIDKISERMRNKEFLGELDHPIDSNPSRQTTVLYKECSHAILETYWNNHMLVGVLETLSTPNGKTLAGLVSDGVPVGFSYRGMGDLREIFENGQRVMQVKGPLLTITWDSVSYPSHKDAKLVKITEGVKTDIKQHIGKMLNESINHSLFKESNGVICLENGQCFLPNDVDELVEKYKKSLMKRF